MIFFMIALILLVEQESNNKSNDDKYFQCAITVALHHQDIKYNPERISKTMFLLINKVGKK